MPQGGPEPTATERVARELQQLRSVLERITGLQSRWSGRVELVPNAPFRGLKPYQCDICLNATLADRPGRWRTLICESLHAFSTGYNPTDYSALPGWEEGLNEQLQRVLRADVLAQLGVF